MADYKIKNALVSVIVPFFNNENTIAETIESVMMQTYSNWELVCVDDGSTDRSAKVVEEYVKRDSRIHLYTRDREPKSASTCRNIGAYSSHGEYLIFLDGDDLLKETCIENRYLQIKDTNFYFTANRMALFIDLPSDYQLRNVSNIKQDRIKYMFACGMGLWQVTSTFWHRDYFMSLCGFNESFNRYQDLELHLRAVIEGNNNFKFFTDNEPDCYYRTNRNFNNEVFRKKTQIAVDNASKFIDLVYSLRSQFDDRKLLSYSALTLIGNNYYNINLTPYSKNRNLKFDEVSSGKLESLLTFKHKIIYFFIRNVFIGRYINFNAVRIIKKLSLRKITAE